MKSSSPNVAFTSWSSSCSATPSDSFPPSGSCSSHSCLQTIRLSLKTQREDELLIQSAGLLASLGRHCLWLLPPHADNFLLSNFLHLLRSLRNTSTGNTRPYNNQQFCNYQNSCNQKYFCNQQNSRSSNTNGKVFGGETDRKTGITLRWRISFQESCKRNFTSRDNFLSWLSCCHVVMLSCSIYNLSS